MNDEHFWSNNYLSPKHNSWAGLAFEHICLLHIQKIKEALQIGGVVSNTYSWFHRPDDIHTEGAQIDLLIMRADNVVNLCEMKFASTPYTIDKDEADKLQNRIESLKKTLSAKQTVHMTMVTTFGITYGKHSGIVQRQVQMDELFA